MTEQRIIIPSTNNEIADCLVNYAREKGCDQFHLDSGVHRFAAHRFYLVKRMAIEAHHFGLKLK